MALAAQQELIETFKMLTYHIDTGELLDGFTLRRMVSKAENLPDEPLKLMLLALSYGAAGQHEKAISFFQAGVEYRDEVLARNYLSFLSRTFNHELYRDEAIRLAREMTSYPLYLSARNAAYADGDGELSMFFSRKAMSMLGDGPERAQTERETEMQSIALDRFIEAAQLTTPELKALSRMLCGIVRKHNVLSVSNSYYSSTDLHDAALICDVICDNPDTLADMDIEAVTEIATHDVLSGKNVTAWFRWVSLDGVEMLL